MVVDSRGVVESEEMVERGMGDEESEWGEGNEVSWRMQTMGCPSGFFVTKSITPGNTLPKSERERQRGNGKQGCSVFT